MPQEKSNINFSLGQTQDPGLISMFQAAKGAPYSPEYLSLRARQGKIRAIKHGNAWRTKPEWVAEYAAEVKRNSAKLSREQNSGLASRNDLNPSSAAPAGFIPLSTAVSHSPYSASYLALRARQGMLRARKFGRNWHVKPDWVQQYINRHSGVNFSPAGKEGLITLARAAEGSPYTAEYLSLRARQGKICAKKLGRAWHTKPEWVKNYLDSVKCDSTAKLNGAQEVKPAAPAGFMPLAAASARSPYSPSYLALRARQGMLRAQKFGRVWHTRREWLAEYLKRHRSEGKLYSAGLRILGHQFAGHFLAAGTAAILLFVFAPPAQTWPRYGKMLGVQIKTAVALLTNAFLP